MEEASSSCTVTQRFQSDLERIVGSFYKAFNSATSKEQNELLTLCTDDLETYVTRGLRRISSGLYILDSSRPWLCYWILHSLALLGRSIDEGLYSRCVSFLKQCQGLIRFKQLWYDSYIQYQMYVMGRRLDSMGNIAHYHSIQDPQGGYGGGPGQMPHLATTYAAVCALVTLGGEKALASINREKTLQFLLRMKDPCGGFRVHVDGEMDMRGSYTALAVADMLNIMVPELAENVGEYVRSCQTYEGGIGGEPGAEAHGGYTFCGLAALALVNQLHVLDLTGLVVAFRQGRVEEGFQGRTNKLVDGCYSFWQGGCFQVLQQHMPHLLAQQSLYGWNPAYEATGPPVKSDAAEKGSKDAFLFKTSAEFQIDLNPPTEARSARETTVSSGREDHVVGDPALTTGGHSSSTVTAVQMVVDNGEFHSPARDFPAGEEGKSDDEDSEFLCSVFKAGYNSADKLFPMVEIGFLREPQHVTYMEVVEVVQDLGTGTSGNSSRSTVEPDSADESLYGPIFNSQALQAYILLCCQDSDGGLRDKPGKNCDYYHTCYCLSGLSAAQYSTAHRVGGPPHPSGVLGPYGNLLEATHALCNVRLDRYYEARSFF